MDRTVLKKRANVLLSLHTNGRLLVLPNIWDPIGARILEARGYPAVATASAAVSASLGFEDGEKIKRSTLIDILSRIAQSVSVPVTADIESGYGETLPELKETIVHVLDAGVVGINIEDSLRSEGRLRTIEDQCERIAAVRDVAARKDIPMVINARIDSFVTNAFPTREEKLEEAAARAKRYVEAGADCVYPIGPGDLETVKDLRKRINAPINILGSATAAPLPDLQKLGVNRVSFGPNVFRSCLKKFLGIADALHELKSYDCFAAETLSRDETNAFLRREAEGA